MDWAMVIERNGKALRRILATLIAMAGLGPQLEVRADGEPRRTLPRHRHRAILRLLRPAEAAARRLIIVAARYLPATPPARREETAPPAKQRPVKPKPTSIFVRNGKGTGIVLPRGVRPSDVLPGVARRRPERRTYALPLTDKLPGWPRPRAFAGATLRISVPGITSRMPARRPPMPHDLIDATRLALRVQAIGRVLDDLPGHARRFARWQNRAALPPLRSGGSGPEGRRGRIWPLRPGRPPGSRRRPTHEIHEILADLHHFAFHALEFRQQTHPDSS